MSIVCRHVRVDRCKKRVRMKLAAAGGFLAGSPLIVRSTVAKSCMTFYELRKDDSG